MKKILIITTGGTLAMSRNENNQLVPDGDNKVSKMINDDFSAVAEIDLIDAFNIDSSNITTENWHTLTQIIEANRPKYDGFVITHGTDTLAFTAAALSYAGGDFSKPIAITGAQVPMNTSGSDTSMNLSNSIEIILSGKVKGVFTVFGSHVLTGTRIKKVSEFEYNAFYSLNATPLAEIGAFIKYDAIKVAKHNHDYASRPFIDKFDMDKIAVFNLNPGFNQNLVKTGVLNGDISAIIIRSYADGNTNMVELEELYKWLQEKQIPVCHISQPDRGTTTMNVYEVGIEAKKLGVVPAFDMTTESLSTKMGWLLAQGLDYEGIRQGLATNYCGEIKIPTTINDTAEEAMTNEDVLQNIKIAQKHIELNMPETSKE